MLTKAKKTKIIKEVKISPNDTGSTEVQVALITEQIAQLAKHLVKNKKDNHSRRGLLQLVADRQTHMKYLQSKNKERYEALTKKLNLKKKAIA